LEEPGGESGPRWGVINEEEMMNATFDHLRRHNPIVARVMQDGGSPEDCAVALAVANNQLISRLMVLEGIAPRKIKLPDGRVMVWRCPDHLIPATDTLGGGR